MTQKFKDSGSGAVNPMNIFLMENLVLFVMSRGDVGVCWKSQFFEDDEVQPWEGAWLTY